MCPYFDLEEFVWESKTIVDVDNILKPQRAVEAN